MVTHHCRNVPPPLYDRSLCGRSWKANKRVRSYHFFFSLPRPLWPRVVASAGRRWLGQQLEVCHRLRTMSHRSADAVVAGIASSDDDDILTLGADVLPILEMRVEKRSGVELHMAGIECIDQAQGREDIPGDTPSRNEFRRLRGSES